jgi:fibronectin type 3 domain-containing protein
LVEAGIDEVTVLQPDAGCSVCTGPVAGVGMIQTSRIGDDVVLDWSADPVAAPAYNVYLRSGPGLGVSVRAGSTTAKTFTHAGAALVAGENYYYEVTAVDACGRESPAP